jgi:hypothetical protein
LAGKKSKDGSLGLLILPGKRFVMPLSLNLLVAKVGSNVGRDWLFGFLRHHYDVPPRSLDTVKVNPLTERCILQIASLPVIEIDITSAGTNRLLIELYQQYLPGHTFKAFGREWNVDFHAGELIRQLAYEARFNGPHVDIENDKGQLVKGVISFRLHAPVIFWERLEKPDGGWVEEGRTVIDLREDDWQKVFEQDQLSTGQYYEIYKQLTTPLLDEPAKHPLISTEPVKLAAQTQPSYLPKSNGKTFKETVKQLREGSLQPFRIYLTPTTGFGFKSIVYDSPAGQAEPVEAALPFVDQGIDRRITVLKLLEGRTFQPQIFKGAGELDWLSQAGLLAVGGKAFAPQRFETIGKALYQCLFPAQSQARERLKVAVGLAEQAKARLVLEIKIDEKSGGALRLADYPWELLHDDYDFLALRRVCVARYIAFAGVPVEIPQVKKLHVLLISSGATDPVNGLGLLTEQERQAVSEGLEKARKEGYINLTSLKPATRKGLREYLTSCPDVDLPHVIHFDGHGFFGKRCKAVVEDSGQYCDTMHFMTAEKCRSCGADLPGAQGFVVLEDGKGGPDYVSARELGTLLFQNNLEGKLALAVLSACKSGLALGGESVFNGVAQNLIGVRIPAVVGMQFTVSVEGASEFAGQFYRALGRRNPLAMAVGQGREAMGAEGDQWYRPALYLRWQDEVGGQLFAPAVPQVMEAGPPEANGEDLPGGEDEAAGEAGEDYPNELDFDQLKTLVLKLESCPKFGKAVTRQSILDDLPAYMQSHLPSPLGMDNRSNIMEIVKGCQDFPSGLKILLERILFREGNVKQAAELEAYARKLKLL